MVSRTKVDLVCLGLKVVRGLLMSAIPIPIVLVWLYIPQAPTLEAAPTQASPVPPSEPESESLADYAPLWQRDLKQPPVPRPKGEQPAGPPPSAPLPRLVATFIETGRGYAHLIDNFGHGRFTAVGDKVDEFQVMAIEQSRVQLQSGDRIEWISLPKEDEED